MTALSDGIQARLRALAETFASELPGRVRDVEESALRLLEAEATLAEVEDLRHHAHKLAGSAATFGFHHVTACAKRLEHAVDEILGDERTPNEDDRERIRALVSELGDAARARVSDEEIEDLEEV
ncbi:MAG: Hpt domain-containing protein, partial [Spirochaetota bacterium]